MSAKVEIIQSDVRVFEVVPIESFVLAGTKDRDGRQVPLGEILARIEGKLDRLLAERGL